MEIEGKCQRCGQKWIGWCLRNPLYKKCDCGGWIVLEKETVEVA